MGKLDLFTIGMSNSELPITGRDEAEPECLTVVE